MDEIPWFEYDEDDLNVAQRAFVDVLAERAASWPVDPLDTVVLPSTNTSNGQLIVYLDIGDPQRNQGVLTVGAHFDGSVARGGELHNQDFTIRQTASELAFEAAGSPTELAGRAARRLAAVRTRAEEGPRAPHRVGPAVRPAGPIGCVLIGRTPPARIALTCVAEGSAVPSRTGRPGAPPQTARLSRRPAAEVRPRRRP
ncbi:hypothetical protein [Streptomyces sp. NPDC088748]|uniref:hypothetical protein n=1 Tax=Streptomyces sp. NPDC088748 TaxID=3365887 RepID=UPI00381CB22A